MKLEHGKRYLLKCGMITPPMRSRHGGISFDSEPVGDIESWMLWNPDGKMRNVFYGGTPQEILDDMSVVCEAQVDITYKNCKITQHDESFGKDIDGSGIPDNRRGRCETMMECFEE